MVLSHWCFPELPRMNQHTDKQTGSGKENTGMWLKFCFQGRAIPVPWPCQRIHRGFEKQSVTTDSINGSQLGAESTDTTCWTVVTSPAAGDDYTPWWGTTIIKLSRVKPAFHTLRLFLISEKWQAMDMKWYDLTWIDPLNWRLLKKFCKCIVSFS